MVCGWNTPTPVIWQEHLYNSGTGRSSRYALYELVIRKSILLPLAPPLLSNNLFLLLNGERP